MNKTVIGPEEPIFYGLLIGFGLYFLWVFWRWQKWKKQTAAGLSDGGAIASPMNWKLIGGRFIVFLILAGFFYPDRLAGKKSMKQDLLAETTDTVRVAVYQKPDLNAAVLKQSLQKDVLDTLSATKYFYKVKVQDGAKQIEGFILKGTAK